MNILKRYLAMFLVLCMLLSVVPMASLAADIDSTDPTVTESTEETAKSNVESTEESLTYADDYRILHLDCGRKYFTKDWIIALINEMAAAGYTHLELAFGNDGLRFLLDDMSVGNYSDNQVTAAIQQGNRDYCDFGTNELTQSEMDAIISHASSKDIQIVPLLNNPGHMNAIVSAITSLTGEDASYNGSASTIDLADDDAVAFTVALVKKYMDYFAEKGCNEFNIGADEYANDAGNGQFSNLVNYGYYDDFINYLNTLASYAVNKGMIPMTFNDGIYYAENTSNGTINENIMVCYWSSGWRGYDLASASYLNNKNFKLINTHGDYYFILRDTGITNPSDSALSFDKTSFAGGSTVSDPAGSMFCIWCDVPDSATEQEVAAAVRITLRKMAAAMKGTTSYSEDVVSGGFNEDGTIAEDRDWTTVSSGSVQVSGYELTRVEVTEVPETALPNVEGAKHAVAWDITPYAGTEAYTERGVVSLPVPEGWNTALLTGFYVENGQPIKVKGTYVDGFYTFDMPHFSVAGIAEQEYNKLIELTVDENKTVTDSTGNYKDSYTGAGLDTNIATVAVEGTTGVAETTVSSTKATTLEAGAKYIIRVYDTDYALSSNDGRTAWGTQTLAFEYNGLTVNSKHIWTLESSGSGYKLKSDAGYLNLGDGNNAAYVDNNGEVFTITSTSTGWTIRNNYGKYINALGGLTQYYSAGGWTGDDTRFDFYKVTEASSASTEITFTGVAPGTTYVTVGTTTYKIIVHGTVEITISYVDASGNTIKTETVSVLDNATTHTVSNFNHNGKFYVVENTTLGITPATVKAYTVTVTEVEEDLSAVDPLTIEYWITNKKVQIDGAASMELRAEDVYGETGVAVADLVPISNNAENPKVLWKGYLLPDGYHQQGEEVQGVDMCTDPNGTLIQKIRYWNGEWEYFNGETWVAIQDTDQIVAYYLQQTQVTDEVTTNVTDWGETYSSWTENSNIGHWFWANYVENGTKYVFLDFAVVYEDGTQTPATFPGNNTWFFHFDGCSESNPRVLKPISFTETGDYEIWKVTVTDGTSSGYETASTFNSTYDDTTETVVWSEEMGGTPQLESLSYTANTSGKLIRVYVRAVETEDTLTVVYYDEKFGDMLYSYNISVANGITFDNITPTPGAFNGNADRIDVSNCGIVNALEKTQYFQTDLTKVPEAVGKYRSDLYDYTGSVISGDNKTLYLYYNINTEALSPNFVADFGLPLTFELADVVNEVDLVQNVTVNQATRYGTLAYDESTKTFTYTPTTVLQNIDVLTINILFVGADAATTTNVGVTPATTVHYEESFISWDSSWSGGNAAITVGKQTTEVIGEKKNNFGYDPAYATAIGASNGTNATTSTIGAKGTFTFTGNGIQIFANSTQSSGYVSVEVKNSSGAIVSMSLVDTVVDPGTTGATTGQAGNLYGLPIVSLVDLQNMAHDTYTVTITKIMDTDPVYIDGIRVFNTMENSSIFTADLEDAPDFYELRDLVLHAIGVAPDTSADYKTMYEQVYDAVEGAAALITDENVTYGNSDTVQDLLDNGPKNEIYLYAGQTLTFKVATNRVMQLGMKAPQGAATASVSVDDGATTTSPNIQSSVDMFYSLAGKAESETTYTVRITNTGSTILSITELKICDDPDAAFVPFTADEIKDILCDEPAATYADAVLNVHVVDHNNAVLGTAELTANGVEGERAVFTAEEILSAAQAQMPEKYALVDEAAVVDVEVVHGEAQEVDVQIGKVATLNVTFVNLRGKNQGTATITVVQTADGYCRISASEIKALAPAGRRAIWLMPLFMPYGNTVSIVVPVI